MRFRELITVSLDNSRKERSIYYYSVNNHNMDVLSIIEKEDMN